MAAEHCVTTNQYDGFLPMLADFGYDTFHQSEDVNTLVHPTRTQKRQDQLSAVPLEYEQRHIAILTIVIAEERQLLGPISVCVAVIEVRYYPGGNFLV